MGGGAASERTANIGNATDATPPQRHSRTDLIFMGQDWDGPGLTIRTKLTTGSGTWTAVSHVLGLAGIHDYPPLTGDVNGDGRTDLIFYGQDWNGPGLNVRVKLATGSGTWTAGPHVLGDGPGIHDYPPLTGDVNGDGRTGLIILWARLEWPGVGHPHQARYRQWYLGRSPACAGRWPRDRRYPPLTGDVNGEGRTDLIFYGQDWNGPGLAIRTKLATGNGTWVGVQHVLGDGPGIHDYPPLTGDVNGEGL